jgi:hypothetical protein
MFYVRKFPTRKLPLIRAATPKEYYRFINKIDIYDDVEEEQQFPQLPPLPQPPMQDYESIVINCELDLENILNNK